MRTEGDRGYEGGRGEGVWGTVAEREAGATESQQGMAEGASVGWEKNKSRRGSQDHPGGMRGGGLSDIHCGVNREEKGRNRGKDEGHMRWDQQRSSRKGSGASEAKGVCREC